MLYQKDKNAPDVKYILENLREADKHEAFVLKGENYKDILFDEIMKDNSRLIIGCRKSDDLPVCMGGFLNGNEKGTGIVWLLSTPLITDYKISFLRHMKNIFNDIDNKYWFTFNVMYRENKVIKGWLEKFGYVFCGNYSKQFDFNIPDDFEFFYRIRNTRGLN